MSDSDRFERAAWLCRVRERTPARLLVGRAGAAYKTATQLQLRSDHAEARDAIWRELDVTGDFAPDFVKRWNLFEVCTRASSKNEYLLRPDLGRELADEAKEQIVRACPSGADLQVVLGDGLSATALIMQAPPLLPLLAEQARTHGWNVGRPFVIRYCRVGVMNGIGELLRPRVVVLLIGERPGMSTTESLSAYMAYQPRRGCTDADRNLISNIHRRGVSPEDAAVRIARMAAEFLRLGCSGTLLKEPAGRKNLLANS